MNGENSILRHGIRSSSGPSAVVVVAGPDEEQKKNFILPQSLLSTPYTNLLGGVSASYSVAGNGQVISVQQINDILLQETRKNDLFQTKERVSFNQSSISSSSSSSGGGGSSFPSVSESLISLNMPPSQVLSPASDAHHQVSDESSDLTSIISINASNAPRRMTSTQEPFPGTNISDSSPLMRGSMSCENSLSELTPSITPVNLIDASPDSLIFEKEVFNHDPTSSQANMNSISKEEKDTTTNSISNVVNNNRLLSKLIQSYKPDTTATLPLRISEFTKIPNASLKPSLPSDSLGNKIATGVSAPSSLQPAIPTSSHAIPMNSSNMADFSCRTSVGNLVTNSLNSMSIMSSSVSNTFSTSNHNMVLSSHSAHLGDLPYVEQHFDSRTSQHHQAQAPHQQVINEHQILTKSGSKRNNNNNIQSISSINKDDNNRFAFVEDSLRKAGGRSANSSSSSSSIVLQPDGRSDSLLISPADQLISENHPISSDIDSSHPLSFIQDQLSQITQLNVKETRSIRPVDMFLSDLNTSDDHDLLRSSLTNTIVPDISSSMVSSANSVVSETTMGSTSHLPELPPSPILANISADFLVGGNSSAPKTSPGSQPPFLPSLSTTTTENLALSFSNNILDNSNMSFDMGSLSEGDASLHVPSSSFADSLDSSNSKKSVGPELNFTNALKNVTEKHGFDNNNKSSSSRTHCSDNSFSSNFNNASKSSTHLDGSSFKANPLISTSPEIFKVPPQMKQSSSGEDTFPSPSKRNTFSAKEIPLIKIDSENQSLPPAPLLPKAESLVQQVSCFKCQLCSYLSLEKKEIGEHMKVKHSNTFLEIYDGSTPSTTRPPSSSSPTPFDSFKNKSSVKSESLPQSKKRKKNETKKTVSALGATSSTEGKSTVTKSCSTSKKKNSKKKEVPKSQMKIEILPREKGGYQRRILMVPETEPTDSEEMVAVVSATRTTTTTCSTTNSTSNNEGYSKCSTERESRLSNGKIDVENVNLKNDFEAVSDATVKGEHQNNRTVSCSTKEAKSTSSGSSSQTNNLKPGRPSASQTMGLIKFKKSHPKVIIPEETLGIRCGVNGCGLRMKEEENILYHRKCHVEAFLKCPECSTKFSHWASLAMHLWRMHMIDMELHKCEKCIFKSYSYTKLMNEHWKTHSTERPFLCDVCGKDFKTAKQLRSHKILHVEKNEELKHHCDMCKRKFAEKRMLLLHLEAVHKKVKPYLCNYCGNSFASKSTLNLHIRKHTGEKPFACESCNYRTSDHNSMRRHRMKHTNDRPYSCPYCEYSSIQSSTFKVHLRRKHEVQAQKDGVIFSCSFCSFKTVKKDNYLAHVGTHHKSSEDEQNKEAERQQLQIVKQATKKQSKQEIKSEQGTEMTTKDNKDESLSPQVSSASEQQPNKHLVGQQKLLQSAATAIHQIQTVVQQPPTNSQNLPQIQQQQHQRQQQFIITRSHSTTPILSTSADCASSSNGPTTFIVTNPKTDNLSQQPMYYVFGELVPVPHVVNIDVNEGSASEVSHEMVNNILLQNNIATSIARPLLMSSANSNSSDQFPCSNTEASIIQSVNMSGEGVVQLTPEVVAMPVNADLSSALNSHQMPGLIYVASSNEGDSSATAKGKSDPSASLFS